MEIPSLSHTFRLAGFINPGVVWTKEKEMSTDVDEAFGSLSIDMVEVGDQGARCRELPPFLQGQILDNWIAVKLPVIFKLSNK